MKEKLLLILFGSFVGIVFGGAGGLAYYFLNTGTFFNAGTFFNTSAGPEGSQFESLDDLRRQMMARDERDSQPEKSASFRSIINPHDSDEIIYDLQPNLDVVFKGASVKTNSCGQRGPERSIRKDSDVFRIALLGDSFAFGWAVEYQDSFAHVLEETLNEYTEGKPRVEVLNFGVPGYSTFQQVALFEEVALNYSPDSVLLYFVDNDFGLPFFIKNAEKPGQIHSGENFHSWSRDESRSEDTKQMWRLLDPNHALRKLSALSMKHGITLHVTINPRREMWQDVQRLWALRKEKHLEYLPIRETFLHVVKSNQIERRSLIITPADPHPSVIMHSILGRLLAAPFLQELQAFQASL